LKYEKPLVKDYGSIAEHTFGIKEDWNTRGSVDFDGNCEYGS
jgi:hypothetical protein